MAELMIFFACLECERYDCKVFSDYKLSGLKSSPVKQVLQHILVSTKSGMDISMDDKAKHLVHPDQHIPSQTQHVRIAGRCCFKKKHELAEHNLTDKEILTAYDIEKSVRITLSGYAKHTGKELLQAFVMEAPVKVLYLVTELVMEAYNQRLCNHSSGKQGDLEFQSNGEKEGVSSQEGLVAEEKRVLVKRSAESMVELCHK